MEWFLAVWNAVLSIAIIWLSTKFRKAEIKLEKLQSKRTEIIDNTYRKLIDFYDYFEFTVSPNSAVVREDKDEVAKRSSDFRDYFIRHKIYFNSQLSDMIEKYWQYLLINYWDMRGIEDDLGNYEKYWNDRDKKNKIYESMTSGEGSRLKREIEDEFRKLIGVH